MTDPASAFSPGERQTLRERLAEEHGSTTQRVHSLSRQFDAIVESSAWTTNDDEHDPEGATVAFERAQIQALLRQARHELHELNQADQRLRSRSYGSCEHCGRTIGFRRLDALPATRRCIDCAS